MYFKDKIVWITGASSGIGEATAYEFAKQGSKLILSSNNLSDLEQVHKNCLEITQNCILHEIELTNSEQLASTVEKVIQQFGNIDILFNNGGISQRAYALDTPIEIDKKLMEIDYFGGITLTKLVLPHMIKRGSGHIAATSSIAGVFGFPLRSAYAAAKHAVHGFYESLRIEMLEHNIACTVICPGRVQTNISLHAITKDGKEHGKMDAGQAKGITVEKCAKDILKAIKKKKVVAYIGGSELLMVHLKRFFPRIFYKLIPKIKPE